MLSKMRGMCEQTHFQEIRMVHMVGDLYAAIVYHACGWSTLQKGEFANANTRIPSSVIADRK